VRQQNKNTKNALEKMSRGCGYVEFLPLCGMRYGAVMVLPFFYFAF
jgi:hypothetical protein